MTTTPIPSYPLVRLAIRPHAGPATPGPRTPAGPAGPAPSGPAGRRPPTRGQPTDEATLLALVRHFAVLYLEVEAGRRGDRQLGPLLSPWLRSRLVVHQRPGTGLLHAVAGARTAADRFDAVAVIRRGRRYGALAVRLEETPRGWLVTRAAHPERPDYGREAAADSVRSAALPMARRPCAS